MGQSLPLRLLVAEDNNINQKLALRLLARLGYQADLATNGLEVLAALEQQTYDVILMDVQMPELDGLEATRRIRQRWPDDLRPHIIAMTANAMQGDRELCLAAGMDDYLSKPVRVEALVEALSKCRPIPITTEQLVANKPESLPPLPPTTPLPETISAGWERGPGGEGQHSLDPAALERLIDIVEGEDELLVELIDTFLEESPASINHLRQAITRGDATGVRLLAHALKSGSHDFGAEELAALCQALEDMGRDGDLNGAEACLVQIEAAFARVKLELEKLREE
jgi:CheY-like chemotaxis protein